jgi:hypothetical protein
MILNSEILPSGTEIMLGNKGEFCSVLSKISEFFKINS